MGGEGKKNTNSLKSVVKSVSEWEKSDGRNAVFLWMCRKVESHSMNAVGGRAYIFVNISYN